MMRVRIMRLLLCLFCAMTFMGAAAQDETEYRMEVGAAAGGSFGLNDANSSFFGQPNVAGGALLRFILNPRSAVKVNLNYNLTKGDTKNLKDFQPAVIGTAGAERLKYNFSGGIADLNVLYELHFLPYGYKEGYLKHKRLVPYVQFGIGASFSTVDNDFTPNIPIGFGLKYKLAERINLGFDWQMHFTISDKLDGLEAPQGIKSTGFKNKDHYHTAFITLTYSFAPKCATCNKDDW